MSIITDLLTAPPDYFWAIAVENHWLPESFHVTSIFATFCVLFYLALILVVIVTAKFRLAIRRPYQYCQLLRTIPGIATPHQARKFCPEVSIQTDKIVISTSNDFRCETLATEKYLTLLQDAFHHGHRFDDVQLHACAGKHTQRLILIKDAIPNVRKAAIHKRFDLDLGINHDGFQLKINTLTDGGRFLIMTDAAFDAHQVMLHMAHSWHRCVQHGQVLWFSSKTHQPRAHPDWTFYPLQQPNAQAHALHVLHNVLQQYTQSRPLVDRQVSDTTQHRFETARTRGAELPLPRTLLIFERLPAGLADDTPFSQLIQHLYTHLANAADLPIIMSFSNPSETDISLLPYDFMLQGSLAHQHGNTALGLNRQTGATRWLLLRADGAQQQLLKIPADDLIHRLIQHPFWGPKLNALEGLLSTPTKIVLAFFCMGSIAVFFLIVCALLFIGGVALFQL